MNTVILYYSKHHGNTKQLLDTIAQTHPVTLVDVTQQHSIDLSAYDRIGFASGIYYSKFHKTLLKLAQEKLPEGKSVFFLYTYGAEKKGYTNAIAEAVKKKHAKIIGEFGCFGYNTFGPFKLIGGIAKGHPDQADLCNALAFYEKLPV